MDKFIFDEESQSWENYISNIKKLLNVSNITTNDSIFEDKNIKNESNDISKNMSFDEKDEELFNYKSEDENMEIFM